MTQHFSYSAPIIVPRVWQPLTDAEFEMLRPYLPDGQNGGRPSDRRRTINAIFWIAASTGPWKDLPAHLGRADSVARTLRRWARAGILDHLAIAISNHPLASGRDTLRDLAWWICRAFRRMARVLPVESVMRARDLKLYPALPAASVFIPDRGLSEIADSMSRSLAPGIQEVRRLPLAMARKRIRRAMDWHKLGVMAGGNRRKWRLK